MHNLFQRKLYFEGIPAPVRSRSSVRNDKGWIYADWCDVRDFSDDDTSATTGITYGIYEDVSNQ